MSEGRHARYAWIEPLRRSRAAVTAVLATESGNPAEATAQQDADGASSCWSSTEQLRESCGRGETPGLNAGEPAELNAIYARVVAQLQRLTRN